MAHFLVRPVNIIDVAYTELYCTVTDRYNSCLVSHCLHHVLSSQMLQTDGELRLRGHTLLYLTNSKHFLHKCQLKSV